MSRTRNKTPCQLLDDDIMTMDADVANLQQSVQLLHEEITALKVRLEEIAALKQEMKRRTLVLAKQVRWLITSHKSTKIQIGLLRHDFQRILDLHGQ